MNNTIDELIKKGKYELALQKVQTVLKKNPSDRTAIKKKAEILYSQNKLEASLNTYVELISHYSQEEEPLEQFYLFQSMGKICDLLNDTKNAVVNFEKALNKFNSSKEVDYKAHFEEKIYLLEDLGKGYYKLKDYTNALNIFDQLHRIYYTSELREEETDILVKKSKIYLKREEYDLAAHFFKKAAKKYHILGIPYSEGEAYYYLGKSLKAEGNKDDAIIHFNKAMELFKPLDREFYEKAKTLRETI